MASDRQNRVAASALDLSNVVAAFSEEHVEQITGLSKGRLRYWAKTGFFEPSFTDDDARLPYSRFYSFKDIVALRTLEMLRVQNGVPLQHLRKVAEKLSHLEDRLWTETTLFAINKRVVVINAETGTSAEVVSGQYFLGIPLGRVIDDTRSDILEFKKRPKQAIGKISRHRGVLRNAAVVSGTRVPIGAIRRLSEDGYTVQQIIAEYPDLTEKDVQAALSYARDRAA